MCRDLTGRSGEHLRKRGCKISMLAFARVLSQRRVQDTFGPWPGQSHDAPSSVSPWGMGWLQVKLTAGALHAPGAQCGDAGGSLAGFEGIEKLRCDEAAGLSVAWAQRRNRLRPLLLLLELPTSLAKACDWRGLTRCCNFPGCQRAAFGVARQAEARQVFAKRDVRPKLHRFSGLKV